MAKLSYNQLLPKIFLGPDIQEMTVNLKDLFEKHLSSTYHVQGIAYLLNPHNLVM